MSKIKDFQATQNFTHLPKFRQSHDKSVVRFKASDSMKLPDLNKPLIAGRSSLSSLSRLKHGANGHDYRSKQAKFRQQTMDGKEKENPLSKLRANRQMSIASLDSQLTVITARIKKTARRPSMVTRTDSVQRSTSPHEKRINQYVMMGTLGIGSYGKVKKCRDVNKQELFAMKIIKRSRVRKKKVDDSTSGIGAAVDQEMQILTKVDHINIIKLHEIIDDPIAEKIYLIMDYLPGGSLMEKLDKTENGFELEITR